MDHMNKLDEAAQIRHQLNQLQECHRRAMVSYSYTEVTKIQTKIGELTERQREILSSLTI
jgi:hypothetical protein